MGWCTCHAWKSKDDVLRNSFGFVNKGDRKTLHDGRQLEVLDRRDGPECAWFLLSIDGAKEIIVCRVARHGGDWGEGGAWPETAGPYERGCPLAWLDIVPAPEGEHVAGFRARVRAEHAERGRAAENVKAIRAGDSIMLPEGCTPRGPFQVRTDPKGGTCTATGPDGRTFKLTRRLLGRAEVCNRFKPDPPNEAGAYPELFATAGAGNPHD